MKVLLMAVIAETNMSEMFEEIVMALGGRVAEQVFLDDISTGASADIQQASATARAMVTKYGMSEKLGPISFTDSSHSVFIGRDFSQTKSYSEQTAALIDEEVKRIFDEAAALCTKILVENKLVLAATAKYLLEHETMDADEFKYLCENNGQYPQEKKKVEIEGMPKMPEVFPETSEMEKDRELPH